MSQPEELRLLRYYARVGAIDTGWQPFATDPKSRAVQRRWVAEGRAEERPAEGKEAGPRWRFIPRQPPTPPPPEDRSESALRQRLEQVLDEAVARLRRRVPGIARKASKHAAIHRPFDLPKGLLTALLRAESAEWDWRSLPMSIRRAANQAELAAALFANPED